MSTYNSIQCIINLKFKSVKKKILNTKHKYNFIVFCLITDNFNTISKITKLRRGKVNIINMQ